MTADTLRVKASSVNPIDIKVRSKTYDDYPDYYDHVPPGGDAYHILGFDGAGVVESVGAEVRDFVSGDDVFYAGSPLRHGSNAEYQAVDSRSAAKKPRNLDFVQAASMPLTWITAYEALVERMGISPQENVGVVIVNGAGGVGSVACQIARKVLELPVVVATAGREETERWCRRMGATHVVSHRGDVVSQVRELGLGVEIKYVFLTHSTEQYLAPATELCAPFGTICSVVQTRQFPQYSTPMMAKSLTFVWELLGTKPWFGVEVGSHGRMLRELAALLEKGEVECHLRESLALDVQGLREAHARIEGGGSVGKVGLGVELAGNAFF